MFLGAWVLELALCISLLQSLASSSHVIHVAKTDLAVCLHTCLIVVIALPTPRVLRITTGRTLCVDTVEEEPLLLQTL